MATELLKCLINYFSQLRKVDSKWKELSEEARRPLQALRNQSEQLQLITSKEVNDADFCKRTELYERLMYKIMMGIDKEIVLISDISTRFNNVTQDLNNRLKNVEDARSKVSINDDTMKELVDGTTERPKLNLLLEWTIDSFNYYNELYLELKRNLIQFDHKCEETIENLTKSFVEDRYKRARIDRIFAFTQFLVKETAR